MPYLPVAALPFRPYRTTPCLPFPAVPRSLLASSRRACQSPPSTPHRATPATQAQSSLRYLPRLPIHARPCPHCLTGHARRVPAAPDHAMPADPGLLHLAMPAAPVLTLPPLPCQRCPPGRAHEALPAVPCPSPTTPSPPCLALPRSASPTSPNQPSRARPCHRRPRLACREQRIQSWPGRAFRSHACRSTPCRSPPSKLGRSDLSGPCLLRQPLRVPATPSAPCLRNLGTPHVA